MTVYDCRCGFSSGTAVGFQRHIARYKGETGKHRMVKRASPTTTPSVDTADTLAAEPSRPSERPSERSWLSGLWTSDTAPQNPSTTDGSSSTPILEHNRHKQNALATQQADVQSSDKLEVSSSGGDSAWEKVSNFAESGEDTPSAKDDYASLTAQLAATGPAAGTRAKAKRPAATAVTLKSVPRPQQADESEAAAASSASESAPHGLADQARGSDAASTSPSEHANAQPSAALPGAAQQSNQGAATSTAAETADAAASHAQERAAADSAHRLPATTTASLHTEVTMPGLPRPHASTSPQHSRKASRVPVPADLPVQEDALHHHGNELMKKSIGVMNWLKASTDAALTLQPASAQSIHALEQGNACSADDVEAVLLWREPRRSSKVFLGGMYILICLRQLVLGVELLQPTTAVAGVLIALLIGNCMRVALLSTASASRRELALQAQVTQAAARRGAQAASVLGAVVVLMYRRLSGHDRTGTSVWLALTLWSIMAVGEAALMSQSSMCLAVWCALFGLPSLYIRCRHILDLLVEEALQLVAAFLRAGQRGTVAFAGGAGLVVLVAVPLSLFSRLSLAVLTVGNVLFWKACMPRQGSAVRKV
ncbi:hypothetical protein ABBQ38_010408 [Trebouxia sp. C0009 RCD-2024]